MVQNLYRVGEIQRLLDSIFPRISEKDRLGVPYVGEKNRTDNRGLGTNTKDFTCFGGLIWHISSYHINT